jgi:hypothetical protein
MQEENGIGMLGLTFSWTHSNDTTDDNADKLVVELFAKIAS